MLQSISSYAIIAKPDLKFLDFIYKNIIPYLQFDYMRMSEELQKLNFSLYLPNNIKTFNLLSVKYFDRNLVTSYVVFSN